MKKTFKTFVSLSLITAVGLPMIGMESERDTERVLISGEDPSQALTTSQRTFEVMPYLPEGQEPNSVPRNTFQGVGAYTSTDAISVEDEDWALYRNSLKSGALRKLPEWLGGDNEGIFPLS